MNSTLGSVVPLAMFFSQQMAAKEARMKEDRQQEDMRLVTQLDQKVSDQQVDGFGLLHHYSNSVLK